MHGVQSVRTVQGNNARMQEKNAGREPVVWVADVRCEGVDCRQNTRTQECKKCAKVEEMLYLYGAKMYKGGGKRWKYRDKVEDSSVNFSMRGVVWARTYVQWFYN